MPTLELPDGTPASWSRIGHGPPILGMPGGPGFPADYVAEFAAGLTDVLTWYLVDPPGTGATPAIEDWSIGAHVAFYARVAAAFGLEQHLVFGHSYSGVVATVAAEAHPDRVVGVLLAESPVVGIGPDEAEGSPIRSAMNDLFDRHRHQPWFEAARQATFGPTDTSLEAIRLSLMTAFSSPSEALADRIIQYAGDGPNEAVGDWFYEREWDTLDLRPLLPRIECPLLSVVGAHDWAVPPEQARYHEQLAPNGTTVVIEDCGHWPPLEQPEAWQRAVRDWLAATGLRR